MKTFLNACSWHFAQLCNNTFFVIEKFLISITYSFACLIHFFHIYNVLINRILIIILKYTYVHAYILVHFLSPSKTFERFQRMKCLMLIKKIYGYMVQISVFNI